MADTRCPNCDHVFALVEVTDGWCAECGKKIPEFLLKVVRPKRPPRKQPPPEPTPQQLAVEVRETKLRVAGLLLILVAIVAGIAALGWGTYSRFSDGQIGTVAWVVGAVAAVAFLGGAVMLFGGRGLEE